MRKEIKKTSHVDELISCDVCGRSFEDDKRPYTPGPGILEASEAISLTNFGGYASIIGDGTMWEIDICQHCFVEKFGEYIRYSKD